MSEVKKIEETTTEIYDRHCMEYGKFIAKRFQEKTSTLDVIAKCSGIREFLCCTYSVMVKYEMCQKLDDLELSLKTEMWDIAKEQRDKLKEELNIIFTQTDMINFCKCLLVIENLI